MDEEMELCSWFISIGSILLYLSMWNLEEKNYLLYNTLGIGFIYILLYFFFIYKEKNFSIIFKINLFYNIGICFLAVFICSVFVFIYKIVVFKNLITVCKDIIFLITTVSICFILFFGVIYFKKKYRK